MLKIKILFSSGIMLGLLLSTGNPAVAQESAGPVVTSRRPTAELLSTEGIIGKAVRNPQGQELGRIESLVMDTDTNQVGYAVLSPQDIRGLEREKLLVPWTALSVGPPGDIFILDRTPEQLRRAPKDQEVTSREQEQAIHRYYGAAPYWGAPARRTQPVPAPKEPGLIEQPEPSLREPSVRREGSVPNGY